MQERNINNLEYASTVNMIHVEQSRLRKYLPQIIVGLVTTLLLLDIGVSVSYPTVVISALTGLNNETNPNETLRISAVETSWMGSIVYVGKLFGSLSCGFASEYFGRRNSMILINIPHLIAFALFYFSTSIWEVFVANVLLGFGSGFMKAPCSTYISEISEVSIRGILLSMTTIALTFGPLILFFIGNFTAWRNIALYCCVVQIITTVVLFFVPESPMWLVSKQRDKKALKSLQWLRGWVSEGKVKTEFDTIKRHKQASNLCAACKKSSALDCTHLGSQTTGQAIKELIRKRTIKPFFILLITGGVTFFSGTHHLSAFMVPILNTYRSPMDPNWATVVVSATGLLGTFVGMIGIKLLGKRRLYLLALLGCTLCTLILSTYGFLYLPSKSRSYEHKGDTQFVGSAIPLIVFCLLRFFTTITLLIPYAMLSELYSMKSRSMATASTTAMNNLLTFVAIKSFYTFENLLDLPSTFGIYCAIGAIGLMVIYMILPETEGRTLQDIEQHFSVSNRKLTDRNIKQISAEAVKVKDSN